MDRPITPADIVKALYESDGDMYTDDHTGDFQFTVIDGTIDLNQTAAYLNSINGSKW